MAGVGVLGTVGVPTLLLILLIGLPFYDRRPERRPLRRPVALVAAVLVVISMGMLTWKGATAKESLGSENVALVPSWAKKQGLPGTRMRSRARSCSPESGCTQLPYVPRRRGRRTSARRTSRARGEGQTGIGVPGRHLKCPSCVNPGSPMPSFAALGDANLAKLAEFLEASKGPKEK